MDILFQLISIFVLGLLGGANPGPIITTAFTEALQKGFLKSTRVIFMAMAAETIVAAFVLLIFSLFNIPEIIFYIISFIGAVVLIWIGLQIWKIQKMDEGKEVFTFSKLFLITIFSGPFWLFWITICVPQAILLKEKIPGGQIIFLALFEIGWLVATLFLTFIFSRFRSIIIKKNLTAIIFKIFASLLFLFAIKLSFDSVIFLLNNFHR